jgi:hypothetical protein
LAFRENPATVFWRAYENFLFKSLTRKSMTSRK